MTYGSEAWQLTAEVDRALNGANSQMLSDITDKTPHVEVTKDSYTFDLLRWIRARRLQWLGHILRMGQERKLNQVTFEIFKSSKPGDLPMDAPKTKSWWELEAYADEKEYWRTRVRSMRQQSVVNIKMVKHVEDDSWAPFTVSNY